MDEPKLVLEWDSRDLEVLRGGKVEIALRNALAKAGGDAIRSLRVGTSRLVRQRKRLKASRLTKALPIHFPANKAAISDLVWRMDVSGELVPVSEFPHRETKRGVRVSINVGASKLITSAFVARMQSGHVGVFRRRSTGAAGPLTKLQTKRGLSFRVGRLPIDEAFTTRVSDVVQDSGFAEFVQAGAQARFTSTFTRLLPLELNKVKG